MFVLPRVQIMFPLNFGGWWLCYQVQWTQTKRKMLLDTWLTTMSSHVTMAKRFSWSANIVKSYTVLHHHGLTLTDTRKQQKWWEKILYDRFMTTKWYKPFFTFFGTVKFCLITFTIFFWYAHTHTHNRQTQTGMHLDVNLMIVWFHWYEF